MSMSVPSLTDIAYEVYQLIREFGHKPFERKLLEWAEECETLTQARRDHVDAQSPRSRYLNEAEGPPKSKWEWEFELMPSDDKLEPRWAWFPPDLLNSNYFPLPLPEQRNLELAEKYAVAVAIYNEKWTGDKVSPWKGDPLEDLPLKERNDWIVFRHLMTCANHTFTDVDLRQLKLIIEEVEVDLSVPGRKPAPNKSDACRGDSAKQRRRKNSTVAAKNNRTKFNKMLDLMLEHYGTSRKPLTQRDLAGKLEIASKQLRELIQSNGWNWGLYKEAATEPDFRQVVEGVRDPIKTANAMLQQSKMGDQTC